MSLHSLERQTPLSPQAREALERMDQIGDGWRAISDLMIPEKDLHTVDRDALAGLLDLLAREYRQAREAFTQALESR